MKSTRTHRPCSWRSSAILIASAALLAAVMPVQAFQFSSGDLKGSFDTTLSLGGMYRLGDPSPSNYGFTNTFNGIPGLQNSVNTDDGDLNFPKGWVSELFKASHELELRYNNVGGLVRGYYFDDIKIMDDFKGRTPLSDDAIHKVGRGAELLDLYAYAKFDVDGRKIDVRIGRQVLSLGESTFLPNGINVINPVDLAKLRAPGAELKEALLPVNMVKASIPVTDKLSIEPFYLLEYRHNEIEPAGTYFSTNDFASLGGQKVMLGFGSLTDSGTLGAIPRGTDRDVNRYNQGGIAAHLQVPSMHDTEFGFFYAHYNSRSPVVSAITPTTAINTDLTGPLTAVFMKSGMSATTAAAQASAVWSAIVTSQVNPSALTAVQAATLSSPSIQSAIAGAKSIALLTSAATGRYFIEYPEGIDMYGFSFNTSLGNTGISWQGEVSYKDNVPLQVDDVELLFATLGAVSPTFATNNQVGNYLGQLGKEISGYRRHDVWTAQTTMTKVFGPSFGASQTTLIGEVGGVWVNLPSKNVLRYDGPGTSTSGSATEMTATGNGAYPATPLSAFADSFSWGYAIVGRLEYNNVFGGVNMLPTIAFNHDVSGVTPLPLGNFIRGRKSFTIGTEFTFQNRWSLDLRYVKFFGAGVYNLLSDRNYVSSTLKYSF